jgi:hypothetical protein
VRFKSLSVCGDDGGYKNRNACVNNNNNKIKDNEELVLVVLNCTLLNYQNDGWTMP